MPASGWLSAAVLLDSTTVARRHRGCGSIASGIVKKSAKMVYEYNYFALEDLAWHPVGICPCRPCSDMRSVKACDHVFVEGP